jgi:hypothetical protein
LGPDTYWIEADVRVLTVPDFRVVAPCESAGMRSGVTVHLSPTDRKRLRAIVDDRNSPQKHVWRATIVLATADGFGTARIMRTAGVSKTAVWRWQKRFMDEGVDGPPRDKTRPPRVPKLADALSNRIVALTLGDLIFGTCSKGVGLKPSRLFFELTRSHKYYV